MWKVTFDSPHGGPPAIYWVAATSAQEAQAVARQQIRSSGDATASATVQHSDDIAPDDELWPRPRLIDGIRVHTFTDSGTAYHDTQRRNDIHDRDVLHIPTENVAGFLMKAWPVAISASQGQLHTLAEPTNLVIDGIDYTASARIARTLLPDPDNGTPHTPAKTATLTRGLLSAHDVWTVTVAGSERHDGEGPYIWVLNASDANTAAIKAEHHHRTTEQDTDTVVRSAEPGAPGADYGWAYNDLRGIASKTIVLTPQHIRQLARLRLEYKRRDDHYTRVSATLKPGEAFPPHEADTLDDMTAGIVDLVGDFMQDLGYPL